ncbi:MAG TPA: Ku protein [Polyangiaceae bacterium]|nr:Ku protein [Polyangiaceae bacterium]
MTARAMFRASLELGALTLPLKFYAAVESTGVHFRLLHVEDGVPVKQRLVDPETGDVVPPEEYQRGFLAKPENFVVLTDEDRAALEPASSRAIETLRVLPEGTINHQWYVRPYYLGPDGGQAVTEQYFVLVEALSQAHLEVLVEWVMRKREYFGVLRAEGGYLMVHALRHAGEVIDQSALPHPTGRQLDKKELEMAGKLVEMLSGDFDPQEFEDAYQTRLLDFVEKKARGNVTKLGKPKRKREADESLGQLLSASLKQARSKRVA